MKLILLITLLLLVVFAAGVASQASTVPANYTTLASKIITVPANIKWTNSSVYVNKDDYVVITASGKWGYDPRPQFETGPNGLINGNLLPMGALIGKIGNSNEIFKVGNHWEGYVNNEGWLFLGMYDTTPYENNVGHMNVNVSVYSLLKKTIEQGNIIEEREEKKMDVKEMASEPEKEKTTREQQVCTFFAMIIGLITYSYIISKNRI
ncbi:MAG: hypothetical protein ACP5H8_01710 [Candidatus Micrarchaeia archaeon]